MRALLDINVLLALFDADHVFHDLTHEWYEENKRQGWASCPLTENGMVRIMGNPNYHPDKQRSLSELIAAIREFRNVSDHEFWSDEISICDNELFRHELLTSGRQLTDIYLLALAVRHGGRLVTLDRGINHACVENATPAHLYVIGGKTA